MKKKKTEQEQLLENFVKEFIPYSTLKKAGFFTKEMKNDYEAQAKAICDHFGYKTIYEYGATETRCHISYEGERPKHINEKGKLVEEPFVTVIKSIYE